MSHGGVIVISGRAGPGPAPNANGAPSTRREDAP